MPAYRPGAATNLITGSIGDGSTFDMLARRVIADCGTLVREITSDSDIVTVLANNGLVGGTLYVDGWADSGSPINIGNLGSTTLTKISCTVMPFASTGESMTVTGTVERIRTAYEKSEVGVAVAVTVRVSNAVHTS